MGQKEPQWTWWRKADAEREHRRISYAEMARMTGHGDGSQWSKWLKGKHEPIWGVVLSVQKLFGWPISYLRDDKAPWPPPMSLQYLRMALDDLPEAAYPLVARLGDPAVLAWLGKCLETWDAQLAEVREKGAV